MDQEKQTSNYYTPPYCTENGCLCYRPPERQDAQGIMLCNFAPRIVSEIIVDDGAEVTRKYRIGGTDAYGMYYQWGRKDPFYGGEKTETSANAFLEAKNGTVVNPAYPALDWAFSKSATTTDGAAANPMTFYNDKVGTGYNWLASPNATLWGEAKTLNDPCPPGYRVPETGAWEDLISGRQYIDGVSVWDGTNYGMTYTHGEQTAWYPAQGYRNYSSGAIVGLRSSTGGSGAYWSAETSSVKSYYLFFRSKLSSSGSINNELDMNRSYGYTVRCCKE